MTYIYNKLSTLALFAIQLTSHCHPENLEKEKMSKRQNQIWTI